MPNNFYSRGYYGYPYPQQNMFPQIPDAYSQYPYMGAQMPQMQPRPYMQNMVYMDPMPYMPRQQYDYPYQQYGYSAQGPYEPPIPPYGMGAMTPGYGAAPQLPPAYAMPMMQPPAYGMDYSQQAYIPPYQANPAYDAQYASYYDPSRQYWADYQANPYNQQYPDPAAAYQGYQDSADSAEYGANPQPQQRQSNPNKSVHVGARTPKQSDEHLDHERRRRAAKKQQEESRRKAAKDVRQGQGKRRNTQDMASRETARAETSRQGVLQNKATEHKGRKTDVSAQQDNGVAPIANANRPDPRENANAATAAAAASIAAFHEAAKSVNEINLNEVTKAIKPKPDNEIELEDLGISFISKIKSDNETNEPKDRLSASIDSDLAPDIKISDASDVDFPNISIGKKSQEQASELNAPTGKPFAMPKDEDMVVISEEDVTEQKPEAAPESTDEDSDIEKTVEFLAVKEDADETSDQAIDAETDDKDKKATDESDKNSEEAKSGHETESENAIEDDIATEKGSLSPVAIVGMVFGIVAVALAAMTPIFNFLGYAALAVGAIAIVVSAISLVKTKGGRKVGKPFAIVGIIGGVLAIILAIVFHFLIPADDNTQTSTSTPNSTVMGYSTNSSSSSSSDTSYNSYDPGATDTSQGSDSTSDNLDFSDSSSSSTSGGTNNLGTTSSSGSMAASMDITPSGAHENLSVGSAVEYSNGLTISVDSVDKNLQNTSGKQIICVTVTYKNNGSTSQDYNSFDWKVEDSNGTLRTYAIYPNGENELNSGELAPGASVTGNLYFEGPIKSIIYEANYWNSNSNASWKA